MTLNESTSEEYTQAVRVCEQGQTTSNNDNNNIPSTEVFHIACHSDSTSSGKVIILWDDILAAFSNVVHVRSGTRILPFLKGSDFKNLDPLRIAAVPGATLDVIVSGQSTRAEVTPQQSIPNNAPAYDTLPVDDLHDGSQDTHQENTPPPSYTDINSQPLIRKENTSASGEDTKEPTYSARRGDAVAQVKLGDMYRDGQGMEKDHKAAVGWYRMAAEQGDAQGQFKMGYMYNHGYAVQQDYSASMEWYLKAAKQGHDIAKNNLGHMYRLGHGVDIDYAQAMGWYRRSADQGLAEAQYNVGSMYHSGQGVPQNFSEAMTWFLKAAEKGVVGAQVSIGHMYQHGQHVPLDFALAIVWYHKAIDQDPMVVHFNLGWMYEFGQGVVKDYAKAMELYKKSAEYGDAEAKERYHNLAKLTRVVQQDHRQETTITTTTTMSITKKGGLFRIFN
ncbi:hypothetical protein BGX24_001233 [Mortierella sp. AD032]|nr:hypothetical protein BGX24_001233 [Mortierella sp. AD032]